MAHCNGGAAAALATEVFRFVSGSRTCREKREKGKEWWRREGGERG
jgi:hypothetical protein